MRAALLLLVACRPSELPSGSPRAFAIAPELSPHPEVSTVLVARWEQRVAAETWLTWRHEGRAHASPVALVQPGPAHALILGLPAEALAEDIALHLRRPWTEQTLSLGSARAGRLPEELPEPAWTVQGSPLRAEPWLLTSVDVGPRPFYGPCYTVILDEQGRIVWYRRSTAEALTWQVRPSSRGGYLLVDELTTYMLDDPGPSSVIRLTLDLAWQERIELPGMMLAFEELQDGSFLHDERESDKDFHLARRHPDGRSERLWSCAPWMEPYSDTYWACATNTIAYNPQRDTVLWSTFRTDLLLEIDPETGAVVREYGDYPGGPSLSPPSSALREPHGPVWTPQGTLLVSMHGEEGDTLWGREFEVDGDEIWRERWSLHSEISAEYGGQIQRLQGGPLLWQLGTAGIIQELSPDGAVSWQIEWPGHLVGHATPLSELYPWTEGLKE